MELVNFFQTSVDIGEVEGVTLQDRADLFNAIEAVINANPKFKCMNGFWVAVNIDSEYKEINSEK